MTNLGMENGLKQLGIPFSRAAVGDRYVMEQLVEKGWKIGAENSGHVILLDKVTTGDAIVAALQVLASIVGSNMSLFDLSQGMTLYPQELVNVRFSGDTNPMELDIVKQAVIDAETELADKGRVLLRKSGTEPLIRVMVEGEDGELVLAWRIESPMWLKKTVKTKNGHLGDHFYIQIRQATISV
ncbi:phosphoglucosamine mutase [Vibrio sp. JCM 19236]|nr:phosphoglucosamine mutase [Vibrio sp. JCM 19236]